MTETLALELLQEAMLLMLRVSAPVLVTVLVIGLVVSLIQAVTQIHEATLSFLPKLIGTVLVLFMLGPWMLESVVDQVKTTLVRIIELADK